METSLDLSRWRATPRGVAYRRWTIVATGLRQLWRIKFFKFLIIVAWVGGLLIAACGFVFSQSISSGGWLEALATRSGERALALYTALGGFVTLFPDVVIGGIFTLIFWLHSYLGFSLSALGLTVMVPRLITRDRASNALTVYLSRPLTSADYLLGKLGMIVGLLFMVWTGPLLLGWLLSMMLAPDRDFIVYSVAPLLHALAFNGVALLSLAAIALGVSALTASTRATIVIWIGLWLIVAIPAGMPRAPAWLKRASFSHDLTEVRRRVFRLDTALAAATELPFLNQQFSQNLKAAGKKIQPTDFNGALASLAAFVALSSVVFLRKIRPE